jgi:hypothetical protein
VREVMHVEMFFAPHAVTTALLHSACARALQKDWTSGYAWSPF